MDALALRGFVEVDPAAYSVTLAIEHASAGNNPSRPA
jgi:hypothetical protein